MKKNLLVPDIDLENQEKFEKLLEAACPELYYIYQALNETGIEPRIVIEFIFQLRNIIDSGWGRVWVDVQDKVPTFVQATRKIKIQPFDES